MTEENKKSDTTEKKDGKMSVVISLLIISIITNIVSAWYFSNQNFEKIMKNEYAKFGGKSNYELANEAQAIQLSQQIDQIKKFVEENKDKLPKEEKEETKTDNTSRSDKTSTASKIMTQDEIAAIKKDAFIEGNKDAIITLVEYSDPECPYCIRQARSGVIKKMREKYGDKLNNIFKNFKAVPHKNSDSESIATLCVGKLGGTKAYSKFYHMLFERNTGSNDGEGIKIEQLAPFAKEAGVDEEKFKACYDAKETQGLYEANTAEGMKYGVQGTPATLVINNKTGHYTVIAGAYPEEEFIKQIDAMLAK